MICAEGHSIIVNKNLKRLRMKIRLIMVIMRCLNGRREGNITKRPIQEVIDEVERIKIRLADIAKKNQNKRLKM